MTSISKRSFLSLNISSFDKKFVIIPNNKFTHLKELFPNYSQTLLKTLVAFITLEGFDLTKYCIRPDSKSCDNLKQYNSVSNISLSSEINIMFYVNITIWSFV